jgi:5-methylcytosine-specific restriction endonuclease McrA
MTSWVERDRGAIAFAERLLTVLERGGFVATYKYAVILGLMELCLEDSTRSGAAPASVTTPQLAEKIVELYWPQARTFRERVLLQNSGKQAGILTRIAGFRGSLVDPTVPLARARSLAPQEYARLLRDVEWILVEYPLPRLQRIGRELVPFVYRIRWDDKVRRGEFNSNDFDNMIRFIGDAGDHLVRLAPLIRPLVQREWAALVARFNDFPESELETFLFGATRGATAHLAAPLGELQGNTCFYCRSSLRASPQVDHFVPWSRHPDDGLDNLVAAHPQCNVRKSDHLAAAEHVETWTQRMQDRAAHLDGIAAETRWPRDPRRTLGVARSIYLRLPTNARLWKLDRDFVPVDEARLRRAFERL